MVGPDEALDGCLSFGLLVSELAKKNDWLESSSPMLYGSSPGSDSVYSPGSDPVYSPESGEKKSKSPSAIGKGNERAAETIVRMMKKSRILKRYRNVVSWSLGIYSVQKV